VGIREELGRWARGSDDDVSWEAYHSALVKSGMAQPTEEKPRGMFHDPYSVMDWGGWRQRPSALTYETLRAMAMACTPIAAIVQIRQHQLSAFARPQQGRYDKGYRIRLRDRRDQTKGMSKAEQKEAEAIERMIETTGLLLKDEKPADRDSFRAFTKKATRDILTYDQWCTPGDTLVTMADGTLKPISAIQPGERVVTHKGRVRRVTEVMSRPYTGEMVRLRYRGQEVEATSGHPFLVERDTDLRLRKKWREWEYKHEWTEAGDLSRGQYLTSPEIAPWGERTDVLDRARVLGLYAGDGHRSGAEAVWTFHEDETDLVDAVRAVFPEARVEPYEDRAAVSVRVPGEGEWFASRCGEGSGNKRVPHAVLYGSQDVRRAFLRGYIEADGHLKAASAVLSTTSLALRGGISLLAAMDGMLVSWSETANATHGWARCWQGRLSGEAYRAFARSSGLPVTAPERPREPCIRAGGYFNLKINRVERYHVEDVQVFNLEVEEDHSYLANGIVSHNCWEKIRDRQGRVSRFVALPSETIRPAVVDYEHMDPEELRNRVSHVQVYENTVISEFSPDDIAWCVMNPRSDLRSNGFGLAPVEQIIRLVTAWLFGFEYNTKFFTQGSAVKGLLNIKGAIPDRQMRAFRRMWYAMISGVQNAWKTPILNSEEIQWVSMHSTNREMEYAQWMDWLTKLICAVYGIDPVEINFIFGSNAGGGSMFDRRPNQAEVIESKDKGLRPLIEHVEDHLNMHWIWELNPDFEFSFTGYDAKAEDAERKARQEEVKTYLTVDEIRAKMDEEPLPDGKGEVILDSVWLQFVQGQQAAEEGFGEEGGEDEGGLPFDFGADEEGDEEQGDEDSAAGGVAPTDAQTASRSGGEVGKSRAAPAASEALAKSLERAERLAARLESIDIWLP
jgi:phage portal protein BeeE